MAEVTSPAAVGNISAAALAAWDAGLCVVRAAADGSKRPLGGWKSYQTQRPARAEVEAWFRDGYPGMGVVCGAVSGDLEMMELEGVFMKFRAREFLDAVNAAGLELLWHRLAVGYHEESPSGGRHFLYRVTGTSGIEGNLKLAQAGDHTTLIETRGEGGFVILAPSHGPVHKSGKPWALHPKSGGFSAIPTFTAAERASIFAVARSFDAPRLPTPPVPRQHVLRVMPYKGLQSTSAHYLAAVDDHLAQTTSALDMLLQFGWTDCYVDGHGRQLVRRPGKEEGVSGSINSSGRFVAFSTSTPFEVGKIPPRSYSILEIIAAYEFGGDVVAAGRRVATLAGIVRDAGSVAVAVPSSAAGSAPSLDEAAWASRPWLVQVEQAARSRLVSPSAVLGCVLARIAAWTPPSTCLPPTVGSTVPLSLYVALRGSSGAGKSSPSSCAADLLPNRPPGTLGPLALGSGEGLVEAYLELVDVEGTDGKRHKSKRQAIHGCLFLLDEGQMLAEIGQRKGATILPTLRTAWSGSDIGQANAAVETKRGLARGTYALGLVSLWQDEAAAQLLADVGGGTPQRFVFFECDDPDAGDHGIPDWPGAIVWEPPAKITHAFVESVGHEMTIPDVVRTEVRKARIAELRGDPVEPLDAHRRLNVLKLAGLCAVLDGREDVSLGDWELAQRIMVSSDGTRSKIIAAAAVARARETAAGDARATARAVAVDTGTTSAVVTRCARHVTRVVERQPGVTRRELTQSIASRDRRVVTIDEVLAEAVGCGWIVPDGDGWRAAPG